MSHDILLYMYVSHDLQYYITCFVYISHYLLIRTRTVPPRDLEKNRTMNPNFNLTLDDYAYFEENEISQMISRNMETASFTGISVSPLHSHIDSV